MALDPNIALGVRPLEVPNQLAQYGQLAQIQNAQRQGEVAQMQLEQLKQDRVEMLGFQKFLADSGDNPDLKQFATRLLRSPKHYEKGVEMLQKLQEQDRFEQTGRKLYPELFGAAPAGAMPMAAPAGAMPMAAPTARPSGALGSGTFGMMPEPVNNLAPAPAAPSNALVAPVGKTPDQLRKEIILFGGSNAPGAKNMVDMLKAQLTESLKQTDTQREMQALGLPLTPEGFKQYKALSQTPTAPPSMVAEYTFAKTPDGGNFRGSYQDFVTARAAAGRAPAQPAQPSAPVAIVGEDGRVKYVTREEALGKTPATAIEGLSPKEIQKREAVLPQARQAVKTVGNTMSVIGETVDRLLANPDGLNGITGTIYGRTPAFTDAANTANADLEQLRNLAFVQGLTELRAASKTGAGVGNVSNREGERFENLKASLDRRQSKTDLENALRRLKEQANFTTQTMQEAFDETYKYKQTAPSAQTPAATPNIDALLEKYKPR